MKPILPIMKLYGWDGTQMIWDSMHGKGKMALKVGRRFGFGGMKVATAFIYSTKGKILVPSDWIIAYNNTDKELLNVTLRSDAYRGFEVKEVGFMDLAEMLRLVDSEKWLAEWKRPDRAVYYGLSVAQFFAELKEEWEKEWSCVPLPTTTR